MIIKCFECTNTKSAKGKVKWSKRAIQIVFTNEKYKGEFPNNKQHTNQGEKARYKAYVHEPIVDMEVFGQVQEEVGCRSSVEIVDGVVKRKRTHYDSKRGK